MRWKLPQKRGRVSHPEKEACIVFDTLLDTLALSHEATKEKTASKVRKLRLTVS